MEKLKLGVMTEVMMPSSWFCPAMPERKASVWKTLRVLSLKVVMPDCDSEYEDADARHARAAEELAQRLGLTEIVRPVDDWL